MHYEQRQPRKLPATFAACLILPNLGFNDPFKKTFFLLQETPKFMIDPACAQQAITSMDAKIVGFS